MQYLVSLNNKLFKASSIFLVHADGVTADVKGRMSTVEKPKKGTFLKVENLFLDLNVKKPKLNVAKIFNNNKILSE